MAIDPAYVSLVAALPPLIVASALCSASETVLFGLSQAERMHLKGSHPRISGIVESMLGEPAGLLATILPVLEHFTVEAAVMRSVAVPWAYLGWAAVYAGLYATVALLVAYVLFQDRDLA